MVLVVLSAYIRNVEELVVDRIVEGVISFETCLVTYQVARIVASHVDRVASHAPKANFVDGTLEVFTYFHCHAVGCHHSGASHCGLYGVVDVEIDFVGSSYCCNVHKGCRFGVFAYVIGSGHCL